jgi:hypothetical protein
VKKHEIYRAGKDLNGVGLPPRTPVSSFYNGKIVNTVA